MSSLSVSASHLDKQFDDDVYQILLAQPAKDKTAFEKILKDITNTQAIPLPNILNQPRHSLGGKTLLELMCIIGRIDHVKALYNFLGEQAFKDACARTQQTHAALTATASPSKLHAVAEHAPKTPQTDSPTISLAGDAANDATANNIPCGYTVAHYAAAWGHFTILEFLSSNTAVDLLCKTCPPRSETPRDIARRNNHIHIDNIYDLLSQRQRLLFACRDAKAVLTSIEQESGKGAKAPDKREREHYDAQLSDIVKTLRDDNATKTLTLDEDIPRLRAQIRDIKFAVDELALRLRTSNNAQANRGNSIAGDGTLGVSGGGGGGRSASTSKGVRGSSMNSGAAKSKKNKK